MEEQLKIVGNIWGEYWKHMEHKSWETMVEKVMFFFFFGNHVFFCDFNVSHRDFAQNLLVI